MIERLMDMNNTSNQNEQYRFDILTEPIVNTQTSVNQIQDGNEFNSAEIRGGYAHGHG